MLNSKAEGTGGRREAPRCAFPPCVPVTPGLWGVTSLKDWPVHSSTEKVFPPVLFAGKFWFSAQWLKPCQIKTETKGSWYQLLLETSATLHLPTAEQWLMHRSLEVRPPSSRIRHGTMFRKVVQKHICTLPCGWDGKQNWKIYSAPDFFFHPLCSLKPEKLFSLPEAM